MAAVFVVISLLVWYAGEGGTWKYMASVAALAAVVGVHYLGIASETDMLIAQVLAEDDRQERNREMGRWIDRREAAQREAQSSDVTGEEPA